jgi:hypothetical protein
MGYPYAYLKLFGIIDSPDDRCSAEWLEYYRSAVVGAEASVYFFERLSAMAQCDPSGIICISFAIPVETAKLILQTAKVPLTLCDNHIAGVDSAEIEAGYENSVKILSDLASQASTANNILNTLTAHDAHINADLAAHDIQMKNQLSVHDGDIKGLLNQLKNQLSALDSDIKGLLAIVLAKQAEIIKLLKTPEGRRPGWQKDGY